MPWSGSRDYDVDVSHAEAEVESALSELRNKGAKVVFVAGHSQGGVFAMYLARRHKVDGVIAISPGGDVGNDTFQENLENLWRKQGNWWQRERVTRKPDF